MRFPLWHLQRRVDTQKKSVFAFVEGKHNKALSEFSLERTTALTFKHGYLQSPCLLLLPFTPTKYLQIDIRCCDGKMGSSTVSISLEIAR